MSLHCTFCVCHMQLRFNNRGSTLLTRQFNIMIVAAILESQIVGTHGAHNFILSFSCMSLLFFHSTME